MALHPFMAFILPILVLIIGEIAFVFLFCRKQRPRLKREDVVAWCWLITIAFGIANIFITANRTEVWIVESDNTYSHKYILNRTGEFEGIGHEDFYVINKSSQTIYCAEIHYGARFSFSSSNDVIRPIEAGSIVNIDRSLNGVFVEPPSVIRVKRGASSTRIYLLNYQQRQKL